MVSTDPPAPVLALQCSLLGKLPANSNLMATTPWSPVHPDPYSRRSPGGPWSRSHLQAGTLSDPCSACTGLGVCPSGSQELLPPQGPERWGAKFRRENFQTKEVC